MEKLVAKVGEASIVLLSVLFLGTLVPFTIGLFVYLTTDCAFTDCTSHSAVFWLVSFFGWIGSAIYINDAVYKN
jgi:hypothetical protein